MRILDVCAGTGSVKRAIPSAEVVSVDIVTKYNPTIHADILKWDYRVFPPGHFDVVWASPPCTHYSPAKTVGPRNFRKYDSIVKRCFEIIQYYKPKHWFMENPGNNAHLHRRPFMLPWNKYLHECCYCRYGYLYKKPTHIWTNKDIQLKVCNNDTPCPSYRKYKRHLYTAQCSRNNREGSAPGTSTLGARYSVPPKLIQQLLL
jgi:hypothetical protein